MTIHRISGKLDLASEPIEVPIDVRIGGGEGAPTDAAPDWLRRYEAERRFCPRTDRRVVLVERPIDDEETADLRPVRSARRRVVEERDSGDTRWAWLIVALLVITAAAIAWGFLGTNDRIDGVETEQLLQNEHIAANRAHIGGNRTAIGSNTARIGDLTTGQNGLIDLTGHLNDDLDKLDAVQAGHGARLRQVELDGVRRDGEISHNASNIEDLKRRQGRLSRRQGKVEASMDALNQQLSAPPTVAVPTLRQVPVR